MPLLAFVAAVAISGQAQAHGAPPELIAKLKALPHVVDVKTMSNVRVGGDAFDITFQQPIDHRHPRGRKFNQHVFLSSSGFDNPVLLGTEGYAARGPEGGELRRMLGAPNLVTVEHRYFGRSIPSPVEWKYLTVKNAADDMHDVVMSLKRLYRGKWVATGASKGGQTALFYKCFYPKDVDATVAYVAPINIGQEDPRINHFIDTVGDETTRHRIKDFQIALLRREDEVLPLLKSDPSKFGMGVAKAYEYGVLEFPYAFWQYGSNSKADSVPSPDSPAETLADAYRKVNAMYYYSNAGIKQFEAFQYQAFTEIGYYNYDISDFKPYLKANPDPTNLDLCPSGTKDKIVYNPDTMAFVFHYLQYSADNVAFIYGETDAWSATQMQLLGRTNAVKIVVKDAWHNANVGAASPEQRELFFSNMDNWLGMKLNRD